MATKKISELEAINAAEDNDVLVIVDTSESTTNKITKGNLLIGAGHTIEMTLNENYQIVLVLKNAAGTALSTQTIDLPNENAVTNLAYNNGVLTITKQSGATSQINLTGLIEGLVTENDFNTFKEALQTTLEAINEKDAEQDEAIAENYKVINKLNEKLENQQKVIDQLPQVEGQETEITLENTIEAQFTKFDVEGNSDQESTKGYQLLNPADFSDSLTNNGITFTNNGDGSIAINGTSTGTAMLQLDKIKKTLKAGKYTFSLTNGIKDKLYMIWSAPYNSTNTIGTDMLYKEVTFDSDTELAYIYIQIPSGYTFNNVVVYPMIYKGSYDSSKPWEKYTGGQASPNSNYEQPIKSAGDNENIFNKDNEEQFLQNLTPDNNGLIVSAQTSTTSHNYIRTIIIPCKSDANYVITRFLGGKTFFIYESDEYPTLNKQTTLLKRNNDAGKASEIIKTSSTAKYLLVKIYNTYASEYYSYDELISSIKIEKSNKASGYSSYGMGSINEKINNKNFAWNNLGNTTLSGVTFTVNENKSITANGTATKDIYYVLRNDVNFKAGETWALSGCKGGSSTTYRLYCYMLGDLYNGSISHTFQDNFPNRQLGIAIKSGTTLNNVTFYPQLELKQATDYVPPQEQDYSIFVQQPFRSNKDKTIRDKFVVKSDGKLYERHYIARKIFDGTGYWTFLADQGGHSRFDFRIADAVLGSITNNPIQSNRFRTNFAVEDNSIFLSGVEPMISIICDEFRTLDGFKTMLAEKYANGNPVYADYLRKTPLDLPCTEEQIQQIENKPSTYKDFTIIQSQDETPAYLEVSGIRDIDTMFDKVTNAIVSLGGNV